jgi:ADP-ribose pyrophosphatase YjhB (NUDIX family)
MSPPRTPLLTVDVVLRVPSGGIVLVERRNPPLGWALPGGFVDPGEPCERAAAREVMEETGLGVEGLRLLGVYSDPARDPRFHTCSVVYTALGVGTPAAGDDAAGVALFTRETLPPVLAFDHGRILADYFAATRGAGEVDRNRSFGVVLVHGSAASRRYLLLRKRGKDVWELPKGRAEPGESPEQAARREVLEETGLGGLHLWPAFLSNCAYERQPGSARGRKEVLYYLSLLPGDAPPPPTISTEHDEAVWLPPAAARDRLSREGYRDVLAAVERFLDGGPS